MGWIAATLGIGLLAQASLLLSRHAFRQPPGPARGLGAVAIGWAWFTLGVEAIGTLGWLGPGPLVAWSASALVLAWTIRIVRSAPDDQPAGPSDGRGRAWAAVAVGLVLWAGLRLLLFAILYPVKVVSDGPIYHLYFAARWWKAGRLFLVASPFGEVGAPYFWSNGEAYFAWLMTLVGGDRLAKVGQVPFMVVAGSAAYAMARRLGSGRSSALIAVCWFLSIGPLMLYGFEPNVDVLFAGGYLVAAYFFLRYSLGDDGVASLILGGLASGLGMGTKPTGVVFFPPLLLLAILAILVRGGPIGRKVGTIAAMLGSVLLTAGFWPIRNAWLTGNPLYPLRVEAFGRVWLDGWFGPRAMERSPYFIPFGAWRPLVDILVAVFDPRLLPLWLLALGGAWAVGRRSDANIKGRWVWGVSVLALANVALYWCAIPYRTEQRFMLHALGLAAGPLALTLDRSAWLRGLAVGLLAVHMLTPQPWPVGSGGPIPWDLDARVPNVVPALIPIPIDPSELRSIASRPGGIGTLLASILIGVGSIPMAWAWLRLRGGRDFRGWALALGGTIGLAVAASALMGGPSKLAVPPFPDYVAGWLELELRSGPKGVRVAYAGIKIPYYLMGGHLRNEVRYINVDAHRDWLMHDYHRAAPSIGLPTPWPDPFPGWDRARPDYDAWLANLRAVGIDFLAVARVNPSEGAHNVADLEWFPIERVWADAHPDVFEAVHGVRPPDPHFRLYRLLPEKNRTTSTDRSSGSP